MELHYIGAGALIFSFKPFIGWIADLKHFKEVFGFNDLDPSQEVYSKDNQKLVEKMKLGTAPEMHLDEAKFQEVNCTLLI